MCHIENILKRIGRKRELPGRACMGHVAGQVEVSPESGSLTQSCPALATSLILCEIRFPHLTEFLPDLPYRVRVQFRSARMCGKTLKPRNVLHGGEGSVNDIVSYRRPKEARPQCPVCPTTGTRDLARSQVFSGCY